MTMLILICIFTALALVGQLADCITTYIGIDVLKVAAEGNTTWLAQFVTKNAFLLLAFKPFCVLAIGLITYFAHWLPLTIAALGYLAYLCFAGIKVGIHNYKINKGTK